MGAINNILGYNQRRTIFDLKSLETAVADTTQRLNTRKAVETPKDDAQRYFTAQSLESKAADIEGLFAGMARGVQSVAIAETAMKAINDFAKTALGKIREASNSSDPAIQSRLADEFNGLLDQMQTAVADASIEDKNLLMGNGNDLTVIFDETESAKLHVKAVDYSNIFAPEGLNLSKATNGFSTEAERNELTERIDAALKKIEADLGNFAQAKNLIEDREQFSKTLAGVFLNAGNELTVANLDDEGAKLLALQTRQQIALEAQSFSNNADRDILRLFGG